MNHIQQKNMFFMERPAQSYQEALAVCVATRRSAGQIALSPGESWPVTQQPTDLLLK